MDELEYGEDGFWQKVQVVDLQEISGPGEERRKRSEAKDRKGLQELIRLKELWEGAGHTA